MKIIIIRQYKSTAWLWLTHKKSTMSHLEPPTSTDLYYPLSLVHQERGFLTQRCPYRGATHTASSGLWSPLERTFISQRLSVLWAMACHFDLLILRVVSVILIYYGPSRFGFNYVVNLQALAIFIDRCVTMSLCMGCV